MTTPAWLAARPGSPPRASQVNQLIGTHGVQFVYPGTPQNLNAAVGAGTVNSNGLYAAQSFTAGSSYTTGRISFSAAVTGTPPPVTYSVQADSAGAPSGTPLMSVTVPGEWYTGAATSSSIPLPGAALTSGGAYWLVASATGDASNFFSLSKSTAVSGASTSVNGTTWTPQAYGLVYLVTDNTINGAVAHTWEDGGARWTTIGRSASTVVTVLKEYTVGQITGAYVQSNRTLTYSGANLTGVS